MNSLSISMIKIILFCFCFFYYGNIYSNTYPDTLFIKPIDHSIVLAGSFGELRSSHFHTGIDIKPSQHGKEGDAIRAAASGFVSRIKVDRGGYGRSISIQHPNGYTTVYAHLSSFNKVLQEYVEQIQNAARSYEFEVFPEPGSFAVIQGEAIGRLGNSGQSYGAHLHFEIRETVTEIPINPLLFGIKPNDSSTPSIDLCTIHGLDEHMHTVWKNKIKVNAAPDGGLSTIEMAVPYSSCGISLHTFDKMDGASNKNGIYAFEMYVDDSLYYKYTLDKISFDDARRIDVHIDYETKKEEERSDVLCFKLPNNNLSIIDSVFESGIIELSPDKERYIRIIVSDFENNKNELKLRLRRDTQINDQAINPFQKWLTCSDEDSFDISGITFVTSASCFAYDMPFSVSISTDEQQRKMYNIGDENEALLTSIKAKFPIQIGDQRMLVRKGKKDSYTLSYFENQDSFYIAYISSFGEYFFYSDTIAPTITANIPKKVKANEMLKFIVKDNVIPKADHLELKYSVWIDDEWYACEYKAITETLYVPVLPSKGVHKVRIQAIDFSKNTKEWTGSYTTL